MHVFYTRTMCVPSGIAENKDCVKCFFILLLLLTRSS